MTVLGRRFAAENRARPLLRSGFAAALLGTVIGCSSATSGANPLTPPPGSDPVRPSQSFATTPAQVWAALPRAFKAVGITVNAADTATRSMGFAGTIRRELGGTRLSKFFNCGSQVGENADTYDINLFVGAQVASDPKTRRMLVTIGLRVAAKSPAFGGTKTTCVSTGELERRIWAAIEAEVQR